MKRKPDIRPEIYMKFQSIINNMQIEINKANNNIFKSFEFRLHRLEDIVESLCNEVFEDGETPTGLGIDLSGANPHKRFEL